MAKKEEKNIETPETEEQVAVAEEQQKSKKTSRRRRSSSKQSKVLDETRQELGEMKDKYLRLFAEFDNYKKRTIKEKLDLMKTAAQDTMSALLPVLDDFDRARRSAEDQSTEEVFSEGVKMVYDRLYTTLKARGLEAMETDGGVDFDAELHEAITEIPAPSEELKGKIVDTIEKGYYLNDKIIRHARVVVGK